MPPMPSTNRCVGLSNAAAAPNSFAGGPSASLSTAKHRARFGRITTASMAVPESGADRTSIATSAFSLAIIARTISSSGALIGGPAGLRPHRRDAAADAGPANFVLRGVRRDAARRDVHRWDGRDVLRHAHRDVRARRRAPPPPPAGGGAPPPP